MLRCVLVALLAMCLAGPAISGGRSPEIAAVRGVAADTTAAQASALQKVKKNTARRQRPARSTPSWELPMQVVIVRSSEKGCEPYCPEWIMAEGMIGTATPALFQAALAKARERSGGANLPVVLHSGGGNIVAALQIGYFLRAQNVVTAVAMTSYAGWGPFGVKCKEPGEDGAYRGRLVSRSAICLSACPLILAGGLKRLAGSEAYVGVHHWGYQKDPGKSKTLTFEAQTKDTPWDGVVRKMIADYVKTMGISGETVSDMNETPFASMKLYSMKRRKALAIVTDDSGGQTLGATSVCSLRTRPGHCVLPGSTADYRRSLAETGIIDEAEAMTVAIVRDARKECEPFCQQWIAAKGVIRPETPQLFQKILARTGKSKLPVVLDSRGGDLDAAFEIGRMIRKRGLDVVVGNIAYDGCMAGRAPCGKPDSRGVYRGVPRGRYDGCRGVCVFVLAAGHQRVLPSGFELSLSRSRSYVSRLQPDQSEHRLDDYLYDMGVSSMLMKKLIWTDRQIYYKAFPGEAARSLNLVTSLDGSRFTTGPASICRLDTPPAHCVKRR